MLKKTIILSSVLTASTSLLAQGCDPMKIFKDQGLVVLKPARTYVKPGGLVALKNNTARYRDAADPVPTDDNMSTQFSAVIMSETQSKTTGFGAALSAIGSIVSAPVGLKFNSSSKVSLAQIDATGTRLNDDAVDAQIAKPNTAAKLKEWLTIDKADAFLVQEVYLAKSLDLSGETASSLDVTFGDGKTPEACTAKPAAQSSGAAPSGSGNGTIGGRGNSGSQSASGAATPNSPQPASTVSGSAGGSSTTGSNDTKAADAAKTASGIGVAAGLCRTTDNKLRFETASPIQFAVRLVQVELRNGSLRVRQGNFKFTKSLGNSHVERITAIPKDALTLVPDTAQ